MPRGRPTTLTPALQTAITTAVAVGVPFAQACFLAGVSQFTGLEWLRRGEARDGDRQSKTIYAQFAQAVTRAKAQDEVRRIARIEQAARGGAVLHEKLTTYPDGRQLVEKQYSPPDWRADAFHLERAYADRWGKRLQADLTLLIQKAAQEVADEIGVDVQLVLQEARGFLREYDAARRR